VSAAGEIPRPACGPVWRVRVFAEGTATAFWQEWLTAPFDPINELLPAR
jgi:hypothetical protein